VAGRRRRREVHHEVRERPALALDPSDPPVHRLLHRSGRSGLGVKRVAAPALHDERLAHETLRALAHGKLALGEPAQEIDLLHRAHAKVALQPEEVDAAADVSVAVLELLHPFAHARLAGAPRGLLEHPHHALAHARGERVVALPRGTQLGLAVPVEDLVLVGDRAQFEADQRVHDLECGSGKEAAAGARLVGDEVAIGGGLEQHEGAAHAARLEMALPLRPGDHVRGGGGEAREDGEKGRNDAIHAASVRGDSVRIVAAPRPIRA